VRIVVAGVVHPDEDFRLDLRRGEELVARSGDRVRWTSPRKEADGCGFDPPWRTREA
jgi:hypothetical protein